mgnify:CR=1 FL=1
MWQNGLLHWMFPAGSRPWKGLQLCDPLHLHAQFFEFRFWDLRTSFRPFFLGEFLGRNGRNLVSGTIRKLFRGSIFVNGWLTIFFSHRTARKSWVQSPNNKSTMLLSAWTPKRGPAHKYATARTSQDVPSKTLYLSHRSLSKAKSYFEPCWNLKLW